MSDDIKLKLSKSEQDAAIAQEGRAYSRKYANSPELFNDPDHGPNQKSSRMLRDEAASIVDSGMSNIQLILSEVIQGSEIFRDEDGIAFTVKRHNEKLVCEIEPENLLADPLVLGWDQGLVDLPDDIESWSNYNSQSNPYLKSTDTEYGARFSLILQTGDPGQMDFCSQVIDFNRKNIKDYKFKKGKKIYACVRCKMIDQGIDGDVYVGIGDVLGQTNQIKWSEPKTLSQLNVWETLYFEIETDEILTGNFRFYVGTDGTFLQFTATYCGFTPVPSYFPEIVFAKYKMTHNSVVDGDTLRVQELYGQNYPNGIEYPMTVRLLCMDTPETLPQVSNPSDWGINNNAWLNHFGNKATAQAIKVFPPVNEVDEDGKATVWLVFDRRSGKDAFNRLLAYAFDSNGVDFGLEQVKNGYARTFLTTNRFRRLKYLAAETKAKAVEIGVWGPRPIFDTFELIGQNDSVIHFEDSLIEVTVNDVFNLSAAETQFSIEQRVWMVKVVEGIINSADTINIQNLQKEIEVIAGNNPVRRKWMIQIIIESLNQIMNPFFHGDGATFNLGWVTQEFQTYTGGAGFDPLIAPRSGRVSHSFVGERNWDYEVNNFQIPSGHYHARVKARAMDNIFQQDVHGYIRIGIRRKGFATYQYGQWVEMSDGQEWITLNFSATGVNDPNASAYCRIQTKGRDQQGDPTYNTNIVIGAVWFSDIEPPEGWTGV